MAFPLSLFLPISTFLVAIHVHSQEVLGFRFFGAKNGRLVFFRPFAVFFVLPIGALIFYVVLKIFVRSSAFFCFFAFLSTFALFFVLPIGSSTTRALLR